MHPRRFWAFAYWWAVQRAKDPDAFESELNDALPGDTPEGASQATIDAENAAFAAFASEAGRFA